MSLWKEKLYSQPQLVYSLNKSILYGIHILTQKISKEICLLKSHGLIEKIKRVFYKKEEENNMLMTFGYFMNTETYLFSDVIEILDKDGNEIDIDPDLSKNTQVLDYYISKEQAGLLTIVLNI